MLRGLHKFNSLKGFSLIEVVLALTIFSIGIYGIVNFLPTLSSSSHRAAIKTETSMLVRHAVMAMKIYLQKQDWTVFSWDDFENEYGMDKTLVPDIKYTFQVTSTESLGFGIDLRKVDFQIKTPYKGQMRATSFTTYLSKP